jgi:histidinol-phosphate aminotransferase
MSYERDNIRRMAAYQWGEQPDSNNILKLNTNENPFPPTPGVKEALERFDVDRLRRYPQPTADEMRRLLAEYHDLAPENFVVTNGGDEGLRLAIATFVDPGTCLGAAEPSYSLMPVLAEIHGARMISIPLGDAWEIPRNFAHDLNEAGANLACVVNPHAPSGTLTDVDQISQIANDFNGVLLVDEAYVDFVDPALRYDLLRLVNAFDNLLVLRSFSKGYSLAGLRLGYLAGAPSLISPLINKTRDSYNVDQISQILGEAAIRDQEHAAENWREVRMARRQLREELITLGFQVNTSQANFLLAEVPLDFSVNAQSIYLALKRENILVRFFDTPLMEDKLRISVGTSSQNARLLSALQAILGPSS